MAKNLCMFALVGLIAAAPQQPRAAVQDQEIVISQIMSSLQPAIDAAIARALGENTVTTITVEGTYGPAVGTSNNADVGVYHNVGYPHTHGGSNQQQNFISSLANYGNSFATNDEKVATTQGFVSGTSLVSTAELGGVVHKNSNKVSNVNTVTTTSNKNAQVQQLTGATLSAKAEQTQQLVSAVMNALVPSVESAVQNALAIMMSSSQQSSTSTSQTLSSTATISASQEQTLVTKIIEVLTPTIADSVRKALAARFESQQLIAQQQASAAYAEQQAAAAFLAEQQAAAAFAEQQTAAAFAAQQQAEQQAAAAFAAQQAAEQQASFAAQQAAIKQAAQQQAAAALAASQQTSISTSFTQQSSSLVAQIIAALRPSISNSVSEALEASRFSQQQALQQQQAAAAAFAAQQAAEQQAAFAAQQAAEQQAAFAAQQQLLQQEQTFSSQSSSLSSSSLSNIFGDGSAHNVKVETPQYSFEYNN